MKTLEKTTRTFYHGTSADNLESILKYGLSTDENKLWNCSSDEVYLWCPFGCAKSECEEEESEERWHELGFKAANESAQIACAISKDCRAVVLKIELESSEYLREDDSCENMASRGAWICARNISPPEIIEISVSCDLSLIKGYFISILINNEYSDCEFTSVEKVVAKCFESAEIIDYIDEIITYEILTPETV